MFTFVFMKGLIDAHEQFKQTLGEADKEYSGILGLVQEVMRIAEQYGIMGGMDNPYTTLSAQVFSDFRSFACYITCALILIHTNQ